MGQTTSRPSVWCSKYYFFFIISCKILCKNPFNYFFLFCYNFTKIKLKSFESKPATYCFIFNLSKVYLVDETIDPATQRIILKIIVFLKGGLQLTPLYNTGTSLWLCRAEMQYIGSTVANPNLDLSSLRVTCNCPREWMRRPGSDF